MRPQKSENLEREIAMHLDKFADLLSKGMTPLGIMTEVRIVQVHMLRIIARERELAYQKGYGEGSMDATEKLNGQTDNEIGRLIQQASEHEQDNT